MAESPAKQVPEKKPLAASGAEVIFLLLLVVLGLGLCSLVDQNFSWYWPEPTEQKALDSPRVKEKQEELTRAENSIKEAEKQLDLAALDQLKQEAVQKTLETLNPALTQRRQGTVTTVSNDAERNYEAARTQEQTAKTVRTALLDRIASLKTTSETLSRELRVEKQMATDKFGSERRYFLLARFVAAVLVPLISVVLVFLVGATLLSGLAGRRVWAIRGSPPVLFIVGLLLILLSYQVLGISGAALIGIIVFLILLQRINWKPKGSEKKVVS